MAARYQTLEQLCQLVDGQLIGSGELTISRATPLYEAEQGTISLLDGLHQLPQWVTQPPTALVVAKPLQDTSAAGIAQIVVQSPHSAFATIVESFLPARGKVTPRIADSATIDPTAILGPDCDVSPGVVIGQHVKIGARCRLMPGVVIMDDTIIGDDCVLFPQVVLYERTQLGNRVTIHAGSVLGAYGF